LRDIDRRVVALFLGAMTWSSAAIAQDTSPVASPGAPLAMSGIEIDSATLVDGPDESGLGVARADSVKLTDGSCPLTHSQLNAVRTGVGAAFVGANAYLYHYFKKAWWSGERAPHFFFHADWDQQFRDQDKFGHMLGGYHLSRFGHASLRAACVSQKKAIIWSAAYAAAFQLQIEIFDGQFKKYGFSYADMIANTTGQTFAVLQELHPTLKAIKPTFSYHETRALKEGHSGELRPSIDYAGQTYWFSFDMNRLLPDPASRYWPSFVRLSAGHSVTDWVNAQTGESFRGKRKIVLSLDFDPEKLPGNAPWWKSVKHTLSYYHFPAPALELTPKLNAVAWYR
jgi:predicted lipoprotein DUF2279